MATALPSLKAEALEGAAEHGPPNQCSRTEVAWVWVRDGERDLGRIQAPGRRVQATATMAQGGRGRPLHMLHHPIGLHLQNINADKIMKNFKMAATEQGSLRSGPCVTAQVSGQ